MPDLPSHAQVVIIGGGVGGCSIAYHLTKMGWRDVVVLERSELTSGATFHSAGLVGQLRTDVNLTKMIRYSVDLYRKLKEETDYDPNWREVGSLRLASSPQRLEELKRQVALARSFGLPLELISTQEAQKLFPIMNPEGVLGAVYLPTDGVIDPSGLTYALAAGARKGGARILTSTRVQAITLKNGRVSAVVTDRGTIKTDIVVNAGGSGRAKSRRWLDSTCPSSQWHICISSRAQSRDCRKICRRCAIRICWSIGAKKSADSSRADTSANPRLFFWTAFRRISTTDSCPPIGIASSR